MSGLGTMNELQTLPNAGPTIASRLLARKRPRLRPNYDSVVSGVTTPVRDSGSHCGWHSGRRFRPAATTPTPSRNGWLAADVSALRVLDVIAWLEGKDRALP
jgi:Family of unknown function (DUF6308)